MSMKVSNLRDNLGRQIELYKKLLIIVREQLAAAEASPAGQASIMEAGIANRQSMMSQIEVMQAEAKSLETEIAKQFGLADFNLRTLHAHLTAAEYDPLAKTYARLGWVLSEIVGVDIDLEAAMRKKIDGLAAPTAKPAPIGKQAIDAYKAQKK